RSAIICHYSPHIGGSVRRKHMITNENWTTPNAADIFMNKRIVTSATGKAIAAGHLLLTNLEIQHLFLPFAERSDDGARLQNSQHRRHRPTEQIWLGDSNHILARWQSTEAESSVDIRSNRLNPSRSRRPVPIIGRKQHDRA